MFGKFPIERTLCHALGLIHQKSWQDAQVAKQFDSGGNFKQLRIEPYFESLVDIYPEISTEILQLCEKIQQNKQCLVHGDFSPKNILVKQGHIKIIDCEVAWYGDPSFDIAFILHHLFIKHLHFKDDALLELSERFFNAYKTALGDELFKQISIAHVAKTTALLMIARIDGKSPVEYLTPETRNKVRQTALTLFNKKITSYDELAKGIKNNEH